MKFLNPSILYAPIKDYICCRNATLAIYALAITECSIKLYNNNMRIVSAATVLLSRHFRTFGPFSKKYIHIYYIVMRIRVSAFPQCVYNILLFQRL